MSELYLRVEFKLVFCQNQYNNLILERLLEGFLKNTEVWDKCLVKLEGDLQQHDFNMWVRPLHAVDDDKLFHLLAPNRFVKDWLEDNLADILPSVIEHFCPKKKKLVIKIGSLSKTETPDTHIDDNNIEQTNSSKYGTNVLNPVFTFENHIEGKSNQIARAAARQVGENPGGAYNPLFIYGGVGLGKTHLMQAAGNLIKQNKKTGKVVYIHSERFVSDFVSAIENRSMEKFKRYYRSLDALLMDDIQFLAGKQGSQEEFFHTFNTLFESGSQIILTSDKFPKEINKLEERLVSRFESGLTVRIDPPELETRVAILKKKARKNNIDLNDEVAFLVAKKIRSNVRELEGALHRLVASSRFTGREIDLDLAKDTLQDLTLFQERQISIDNIQKTVADFYSMRVADLKSKRRSRQIARPRQLAMALAKELTTLSLPDIGDAFGGRDHTTVLHACRKINDLIKSDSKIKEDFDSLQKILSV